MTYNESENIMNRAVMRRAGMESKRVSISSKRQITIPQRFFLALGFGTEAECILRNNELVIRPAREQSGGEFSEMILADLIDKGLSGEELLSEFKKAQKAVRPAVEAMIADAEQVASGEDTNYMTYDDLFGSEEE